MGDTAPRPIILLYIQDATKKKHALVINYIIITLWGIPGDIPDHMTKVPHSCIILLTDCNIHDRVRPSSWICGDNDVPYVKQPVSLFEPRQCINECMCSVSACTSKIDVVIRLGGRSHKLLLLYQVAVSLSPWKMLCAQLTNHKFTTSLIVPEILALLHDHSRTLNQSLIDTAVTMA